MTAALCQLAGGEGSFTSRFVVGCRVRAVRRAEEEADGSVGGVAAVASEAAVSHIDGDGGHPATNGQANTTKDLEKSPVVKLLSSVRTGVGETSTSTGTSMEERNGSNIAGPPPDSAQTEKSLRVGGDGLSAEHI